jgi:hypothetical protein
MRAFHQRTEQQFLIPISAWQASRRRKHSASACAPHPGFNPVVPFIVHNLHSLIAQSMACPQWTLL